MYNLLIYYRKFFVNRRLCRMGCLTAVFFTTLVLVTLNFSKAINPTEIQVNYEVLCPDSVRFINNHLSKALELFKGKINVKLIPFGIASYLWNKNNRVWEFKCHHGESECFANMLHVNYIKFYFIILKRLIIMIFLCFI